MPIPKRVVEEYLNRPVDSLSWFKDLKPLEVEEELSYIKPKHKFHCPLRVDQKILFLLGLAYPNVLFMADLGVGKTVVSLELLSYFYKNGFIRHSFVFTPTDEVAEGWEDEIKRWGFDIPFVRLTGSSKNKWEQLQSLDTGIAIGTYMGISAMVAKLAPVVDANGKDLGKRKRQINPRSLLSAIRNVDALVYDQSTRLGSTNSLSFRVCTEFSREAHVAYGLAGRAFGRDPFMLWSQLYLVDRGRALGTSPGLFREAFWRRVQSPWGISWTIRKRREPILAQLITASSIRYSIEECVQLPPKVFIKKECEFPKENWTYYEQVKEELISAKGNYREIENSFLKMRQISSGFIGFKDDDTGEKAQIEFLENPKLNLLMQLVDEVPEDRKMVIFYEYSYSGARICQELAKLKYKFGWLWSGTKDWTKIKNSFNTDPNFRIIVANWKKGGMGLNLQTANYIFYYESPVSSIERVESEGRIYRTGQKYSSFIYDLLVKNSADQRILELHQEGGLRFKNIVENPAKYFRKE